MNQPSLDSSSAPRRHVVLVGPMASGKTVVGKHLARLLGLPFLDLDSAITQTHGSIPEIFAERGEAGFRALETLALRAALEGVPAVISPGGGVVLAAENRDLLARATVARLSITRTTAARRLRGHTDRPLLAGEDPMGTWERLMRERSALYDAVADVSIAADRGSAQSTARQIAALLNPAATPLAPATPPASGAGE